jgi:hypothetical protein
MKQIFTMIFEGLVFGTALLVIYAVLVLLAPQ